MDAFIAVFLVYAPYIPVGFFSAVIILLNNVVIHAQDLCTTLSMLYLTAEF